MNKDDVKAIILIFFILLLMSAIVIFGIGMYRNIVEEADNEQEILYQGNETISPDEQNNNNSSVAEHGNETLEQIISAGNQNQVTQPNAPIEESEYYYKQLNSYEQTIYNELKNNKENLKTGTYKLNFEGVFNKLLEQENGAELLQDYYQSAIESYLYDNPDTFYLDATKMYINIQTTKKLFSTTYDVYIDSGDNSNYLADGYNSSEQIKNCENQMNQKVQKIIATTEGKSDYQKILIIHDYLVDNISYEQTISKDNIYNIYGALVNGEAVCEGYAKAFKYLMQQLGIESIVVIGKATDSNGRTQNHAWNYVELDNIWYAVDTTWDDPVLVGGGILGKKHKYNYFLKGSSTMSKDHVETFTFVNNGKVYEHPTLSVTDY